MLIRLLLLFLLGVFLAAVLRLLYVRYQPPPRQMLIALAGAAVILGLAALVASGRLHWLLGVAAGLLPFARRALVASGALRLLNRLRGAGRARNKTRARTSITRAEALAILELSGTPDAATINRAHRRLMQRFHPDHGGSEYFARRLNAARERLLEDLKEN